MTRPTAAAAALLLAALLGGCATNPQQAGDAPQQPEIGPEENTAAPLLANPPEELQLPASFAIPLEVKLNASQLRSGITKKDGKTIQIHCNSKTNDLTTLVSRFHSNEEEQATIRKHSDRIKHQKIIGASIKGCIIAKGEAEMSYRFSSNTKEWDTCAMQAIVEQAGGLILKFDGEPIHYNREDVYNRGGYVICNCRENFLI